MPPFHFLVNPFLYVEQFPLHTGRFTIPDQIKRPSIQLLNCCSRLGYIKSYALLWICSSCTSDLLVTGQQHQNASPSDPFNFFEVLGHAWLSSSSSAPAANGKSDLTKLDIYISSKLGLWARMILDVPRFLLCFEGFNLDVLRVGAIYRPSLEFLATSGQCATWHLQICRP